MAAVPVITCPACAKRFKGREGLEGKKIRCPACGHAFIVQMGGKGKPESSREGAPTKAPAKAGAKAPAQAPPAPEPPPPDQEVDEEGNPYGVTTLDLRPRCPSCANELVSEDALICVYCGYNTQTRTTGKTKKVIGLTFGDRLKWLLPGLGGLAGILILYFGFLFYCLALPGMLPKDSWTQMFVHESMRLWIGIMVLGGIWAVALFGHKRLVFEPTPPEVEKE
ncbi:MAG: hypothetical protein IT429_05575 [Gemmataceae bacterium]|nr:hypothetical protein [Gemmataceae bacterium]